MQPASGPFLIGALRAAWTALVPAAAAALEPAFEQLWTWEERDRDSCSRSRGTRLASQMEKRGEEINLHGISRPGFNGVAPRERERLADREKERNSSISFLGLEKETFLSFLPRSLSYFWWVLEPGDWVPKWGYRKPPVSINLALTPIFKVTHRSGKLV